jgi:hypothetical protein
MYTTDTVQKFLKSKGTYSSMLGKFSPKKNRTVRKVELIAVLVLYIAFFLSMIMDARVIAIPLFFSLVLYLIVTGKFLKEVFRTSILDYKILNVDDAVKKRFAILFEFDTFCERHLGITSNEERIALATLCLQKSKELNERPRTVLDIVGGFSVFVLLMQKIIPLILMNDELRKGLEQNPNSLITAIFSIIYVGLAILIWMLIRETRSFFGSKGNRLGKAHDMLLEIIISKQYHELRQNYEQLRNANG